MTLILFPFLGELKAFLGFSGGVTERRVHGFRMLESPARPGWKLAVCGQGKVQAALACAMLGQALKPESVLLLGSATALDPGLSPGDFIAAEECIEVDFRSLGESGQNPPPRFRSTFAWPMAGPALHRGPVLSADGDVFDPGEKRALGERFQALAYAWEGAGFHRALIQTGLPGLEIRVITEGVGEEKQDWKGFEKRLNAYFPPLHALIQDLGGQ